jgi:hypothetical protein
MHQYRLQRGDRRYAWVFETAGPRMVADVLAGYVACAST